MLTVDAWWVIPALLVPTIGWFVFDYRKWSMVDLVRTAIKENLVLPTLYRKGQAYRVVGVKHDGILVVESIDTGKLHELHYRQVKFVWK